MSVFAYLILAGIPFIAASCRGASNNNEKIGISDAPNVQQTATPMRELNEKRVPAMSFRAWHRNKSGMILDKNVAEYYYISALGTAPAPFDEYEIKQYPDSSKSNCSHSGKYEITVNRFNEHTKNTSCCSIQEFDYEVVLSTVGFPTNKTKLADENWDFKEWSPDDKFILFSRASELFLIDAETKEKTTILSDKNLMRYAFARSGKALFLIDRSKDETRLEYFDIAAKQLTVILSPLDNEPGITISPDGGELALFSKIFTGNTTLTADNRLYLFDAETRAKIGDYVLPKGSIYPNDAGWQASGQEFGFTAEGENYTRDVYSVNIGDGKIRLWYPPTGETTGLYK